MCARREDGGNQVDGCGETRGSTATRRNAWASDQCKMQNEKCKQWPADDDTMIRHATSTYVVFAFCILNFALLRSVLTMRRRIVLPTVVSLVVLVLASGLWVRHRLDASLPLLDGSHQLAGVSALVTVTRDALGIPTIQGQTR